MKLGYYQSRTSLSICFFNANATAQTGGGLALTDYVLLGANLSSFKHQHI